MKQLGLAMHNYHSANDALPYAACGWGHGGWVKMTLPFIDQAPLAAKWNEAVSYGGEPNLSICRVPLVTHLCPTDLPSRSSWGGTAQRMANFNYAVNLGCTSVFRVSPLNGTTFRGAPFYYGNAPDEPETTLKLQTARLENLTDERATRSCWPKCARADDSARKARKPTCAA